MSWAQSAINEIKNVRIPHRNYERALSDTLAALVASAPGEVVCITGPSRVGKSRLAQELSALLVGDKLDDNDGRMPVVIVQASNCSVDGGFSTKSFSLRCLQAVHHPFYGVGKSNDVWETDRYRLVERTPETVLRPAFEQALVNRGTKYLFIDEAHHISYARGGDSSAAAILDSWKCLAADTNVVLVLVGAYPLVNVLQLSPHLLGRKHQIHFPRYYATQDDLIAYQQILDVYSSVIRLPAGVGSLRDWNDLLYQDAIGCIGLLERWLRKGLALAHSKGSDVLEKVYLLNTRTPTEERRQLALEIREGEALLEAQSELEEIFAITAAQPQRRRARRKPFQVKPRRYPVN